MRDIQELIENVEKYRTVVVQKRFRTKKNTVAYVVLNGQPRILKWFVPGLKQNMEIEYKILKKGFSNLTIPSPFEKDLENNVLVMSYITGENVCDILHDPQKILEEKTKIVHLLADWFVNFHTFFKSEEGFRLRGDANLKNFILSKGRIWGVDFEESRIGKPSEDLATLCVSLLSSDPMFSDEKFQFCQSFLDAYQKSVRWDVEQLNKEISYALLERIQWRQEDEEVLRKYANIIRNKGLRVARHNFGIIH
jgi:tRNA A-37 threonylcarbamoyl transferase component Bud32